MIIAVPRWCPSWGEYLLIMAVPDCPLYDGIKISPLNNYIQIFDYNGKIINKINGKIENMVIHGDYYIFNDKSDDSNMLHLFSRDKIKYYTSYYSPVAKNITSIFSDNEYLYIINNYCSIKKIKLQLETNNNKLLLLTIGTLMYKLLS